MTPQRGRQVPALYVCYAPVQCAPCRANDHPLCSWDGEPDCQCTGCPPERKRTNLASLDAVIGTAYGPDGELLADYDS